MKIHRKLFSLIIKILILLGLLLLVMVFINSLFTSSPNKLTPENNELPIASIDITDMYQGQIRKVRWYNKEVAVLLRQFSNKLTSVTDKPYQEQIHSSLDLKTRSLNSDYFVYVNLGDSNNCPLFYSAGEFKDICSSNKFDEAGRSLNGSASSFSLQIPPHYFEMNMLIIGKWQP